MNYKNVSHTTLTQFSTVNALLVGLYDGCFPVSHVCAAGDLGLGCSHTMDGEMILINGECYIARANQPLKKMTELEKVPFAQAVQFRPRTKIQVSDVKDKDHLTDILLAQAETNNLFIGFRLAGRFKRLKLRQPPATPSKPYPPMMEFLAHQKEIVSEDVSGTLVGFWSPKQYQGTTVAGIHTHYIDNEKKKGGHVMDVAIESGTLEFQLFNRLEVQLPDAPEFLNADLTYEDLDAHIKHAEG